MNIINLEGGSAEPPEPPSGYGAWNIGTLVVLNFDTGYVHVYMHDMHIVAAPGHATEYKL